MNILSFLYGNIKNKYRYDVIAFLAKRRTWNLKQGEAFDIITDQNFKRAIFSPPACKISH